MVDLWTSDNTRITAHRTDDSGRWTFTCQPARTHATVILLHGLAEHAARHFVTARRLARCGVATIMPELPGHGSQYLDEHTMRSVCAPYALHDDPCATRAALSEMTFAPHAERLGALRRATMPDAVECLRAEVKRHQPTITIGFSLGGAVALRTAQLHDLHGVRRLILINPGLAPAAEPGSRRDTWLRRSWRAGGVSGWLNRFTQRVLGLIAPLLTIDCTWVTPCISDIDAERQLHRADPLIHRRLPGAFLMRINRMMNDLHDTPDQPRCPIHCITSGRDGIVNQAGMLRWADAHRRTGGTIDTLTVAQSPSHDIHRSRDADRIHTHIESLICTQPS